MASVILSTAASAAASQFGLSGIGASLVAGAAQTVGSQLDGGLFGSKKGRHREGARLAELSVQTSTYGKMIPMVYGSARIAGNVIWSRPIKEVGTTTTTTQGGKGGGGVSSSSTEFSYYVTLAIAICEGRVDTIDRVWADAKQLDTSLGTYRFYKGGEDQEPDALIESFEGTGMTPAYRGLSYVVIEDFPLAEYGNRIPNFTFEVKKKILWPDVDGESVENLVTEMILIPGSGEFVYDTTVQFKQEGEQAGDDFAQKGYLQRINMHNPEGRANALLALDQLEETCPNVEWVGVVVNWFGTDMDAADCVILPGVEFESGAAITTPEDWSAASFSRASAHAITYVDGSPRYGGTPDDQSLLRLLDELKDRGYNIFFYPMFLMDVPSKPWRGRVTGSASAVANFFTKTNGYNAFITHYANLVDGKVDAFAIGSELIGLTKVHNGASVARQFPAVDALVDLAQTVKGILGGGVIVTYAADWSEYHHTDDGWYNLDPLWASGYIDRIGIDAYFPLTNLPQNELGYGTQAIVDGWTSGEGYDYYYVDEERTTTAPLGAAYAWKNIAWFWENNHVNPDGATTAWSPESKKIWFTEFGFPSVDGATNQPNVFYDPSSSESYFPRLSKGRIDFRAQRAGIAATLAQWAGSDMIERKFLWTWDARPYPFWPDLRSVWADGGVWKTGHWVQGKFGLSALAAIVADICQRAGLNLGEVDVSRLTDQVEGYVISRPSSARELIEQLMAGYFFDVAETDGSLHFIPRGNASEVEIEEEELLPDEQGVTLHVMRAQELDLPQKVEVGYINRLSNYQPGNQYSERMATLSQDTDVIDLPIVMADQKAKVIADVSLYQAWMARTAFQFDVGMKYATLEPCDVVTLHVGEASHVIRISQVTLGRPGVVRVRGVAEDASTYDFYAPPAVIDAVIQETPLRPATRLEMLDMPALATDNASDAMMRFAAVGQAEGWMGASVYRSDDAGGTYQRLVGFAQACVIGSALGELGDGPCDVFDEVSLLEVVLMGDATLSSATELAVLNGANLMLVGDELIQFKAATQLSAGKYALSGLLRGRLGTEWATATHSAGERVVLIDARLQKDAMPDGLIGLSRDYKPVSVGKTLGQTDAQSFTYTAKALKPYAPVHVSGERDGSGNLTIRWVRRTRVGGAWRDGVDVPLSEDTERYEIDILDGDEAVRTLVASSPEVNCLAAQQVSDFGAEQSSVNVVIYQISSGIGRGYGAAGVA